jgi:protoporphyrinogen oxidase|tara:strand:- start:2177 stop:3775 length:1599 start_codon:yes stop_codon:yes gene_type:complete
MRKIAIIIGAGPAGLTAAYEFVTKTDIKPIVIEKSNDIGGIAKTVVHNGNRIDIGGHRFFSKSDVVMDWWQNIMPIQGAQSKDDIEIAQINPNYQNHKNLNKSGANPEKTSKVMLLRNRMSRIFFLRKFFDYPVSLSKSTLFNLGLFKIIKIGYTYLWIKVFPRKQESTLEDFLINRFGNELYITFFKDYTEKVWGVPCSNINADWGAQRIKGLSISRAILHAIKSIYKKEGSIKQKKIETSLIGQFLYPKLGPGSMWEEVTKIVKEKGGEVIMNSNVVGIEKEGDIILKIRYMNELTKETHEIEGAYFFSTMPIKELINAMGNNVSTTVKEIANGLQYRDFITVGLLLNKLKIKNRTNIPTLNNIVPDNWIYIQDKDVKVGRLQIFNNWSPYMVADSNKVWIGLEYFCNEGDDLWSMNDDDFMQFAIDEVDKIDIIEKEDVLDKTLIRMPKTYPAYFGTYPQFDVVRDFTDKLKNLFLIGRNGMHKYNNQDHSMLTAITAVQNIIKGVESKNNIWSINMERDYHEEKEQKN